jgi:hypothetical protein
MRKSIAWATLALAFAAPATQAGFIGDQLSAVYYTPDLATPYPDAVFTPTPFTVGPGVDTVGDVEGVTTLTVDFTDTRLTILLNTTLSSPTWVSGAFNGPVFTLQTPGSLGIAGASVVFPDTTMAGFDDSRVTFTDTQIRINWQGLSYVDGTQVVVDFASVPEPSSIVAMAAGCVGLPLLAMARRRRAG